jgi:hypothetical protein
MNAKIIFFLTIFIFSNLLAEKSDKGILQEINRYKPSKLEKLPKKWKGRIGPSLADPKYNFTSKPVIIEGVEKTQELGYSIIKLFVPESKLEEGTGNALSYYYNSDWQLKKGMSLKAVLAHPYFKKCFTSGIKTFALDCTHGWDALRYREPNVSMEVIEQEMYDAVKYLLSEYKERNVTFILQNWEGDWLFRGEFSEWSKKGAPDKWQANADLFVEWIRARQRGVDRAREDSGKNRCKVFHAVEANKVLDGMAGIPSVASYVLPRVKVDMASWSSYDGMEYGKDHGLKMYKGCQFLKKQLRPSTYMKGRKVVYIGEVGVKENTPQANSSAKTYELWDTWMGVYIALDIPYVFQWALYDNEFIDHSVSHRYGQKYINKDMMGMWLIRADGTKSWTQTYFDKILK